MKAKILVLSSLIASCITNGAMELSMPIDCVYGENCFIQNYYDLGNDETGSAKDYKCGNLTYKGHNGVDFRILDYNHMKKGIKALAAAGGIVKAVRNNEPEFIFYKNKKIAELNAKECGNGVVISHADNYETQYCHLKKNSITVKKNQQVKSGDVIGLVGMSGATEFPHLHMSLRKNNTNIDPFSNKAHSNSYDCNNITNNSLWDQETKSLLDYLSTSILNFHVTDIEPKEENARFGEYRTDSINNSSDKVILWADIINIEKDDQVILSILDENSQEIFKNTTTLNKRYAQYFIFSGKKLDKLKLDNKPYTANIKVLRDKKIIDAKKLTIKINRI